MSKKPKVISIFTGAGGIDVGFHKAGYEVVYSTDLDEFSCETIKKNKISDTVECRDIRGIDFRKVLNEISQNDIDCLVGGPPCPPYSKSRFYLKDKKRALKDENSYTLTEYFRAVKEIQPKVFFFENVHGFIYKPHKDALEYLKEKSNKFGYKITYKVVNAANYGVPQTRERLICIGVRKDFPYFIFPEETHFGPNEKLLGKDNAKSPWATCQQAIGDLDIDLPEDATMQAGSRHKDLLKLVPPGDNYLYFTKKRGHLKPIFKWRSRYWSFLLKLSPDRPSWTIQASHSNNMGPFHWKNRFLRISEIKRIQTFDDEYEFAGDFRAKWRQIGNAVPPQLAKVFAIAIREQILDRKISRPQLAHAEQILLPL